MDHGYWTHRGILCDGASALFKVRMVMVASKRTKSVLLETDAALTRRPQADVLADDDEIFPAAILALLRRDKIRTHFHPASPQPFSFLTFDLRESTHA